MKPNPITDAFFFNLITSNQLHINDNVVYYNDATSIPYINADYNKICVRVNNKSYYIVYHRLVWMYYNGAIPPGMLINHIDGDKLNNNISNLELATYSSNNKHARDMGLNFVSTETRQLSSNRIKGANNHTAKLTTAQVLQLRSDYAANKLTVKDIDTMYRLGSARVKDMLSGVSYSDVPGAVNVSVKFRYTKAEAAQWAKDLADGLTWKQLDEKYPVGRSSIRRYISYYNKGMM